MSRARLAVGAALLLGAAPFAAPSHARCSPDFATVCATVVTTCRKADAAVPVDLNCPVF